ncbi:sugar ABC transporter ATP-binding protein [Marinibaculum pumilum]|uniref:Sugar ABC transporter ATP-binding protein n=1 Tax=Marinibaculum pumilum TaxID=1766165 RepID=A0ABV7KVI6_9PROT
MQPATPLLEVRALARHYAGVAALRGVDLSAVAGEVHAVVGANGAGKSTLMNLLSGTVAPSAGEILIDGRPAGPLTPALAREIGIATVYQEFSLVPQLTVARNVFLGREPLKAGTARRLGAVDEARMVADTAALLQRHHLALDPQSVVEGLSVAQQQMVELARALAGSSRVLILDEPTAVLSLAEQRNLFEIIARLKADGLLILYVSHRLEEVLEVADRVTVLRDGALVATRPAAGLDLEELVTLMVGETGRHRAPPRPAGGEGRIELHYRRGDAEGRIRLDPGEIVGLGGLVGAGRTSLGRALCGLGRGDTEVSVRWDGETIQCNSPAAAMRAGFVYLTEDRKRDGLFANLDILTNTSAAALSQFARAGFLNRRRERRQCSELLQRMRLAARSLDMPVDQLSGGNQQKVVFGRALLRGPRLLVCDEPTRGVDIGAKAEIYDLLEELAGQGVAVLVISSEIEELLALTSRIVVMRDRRIVTELPTAETDEAAVLLAASGGPEGQMETKQ